MLNLGCTHSEVFISYVSIQVDMVGPTEEERRKMTLDEVIVYVLCFVVMSLGFIYGA